MRPETGSGSTPQPSLADDRLDGVKGISRYWYGEDSPSAVRKTRWLIVAHDLPVVQSGNLIWSFKSWLDRFARGEQVETGTSE